MKTPKRISQIEKDLRERSPTYNEKEGTIKGLDDDFAKLANAFFAADVDKT